ncbi:hypothetical protein AWC38_SpisGene22585, partial [Stylophora pistillata]
GEGGMLGFNIAMGSFLHNGYFLWMTRKSDFDIPSVASTSQEGQENRKLKVTLLSSEWRSSTDGDLSTINRELAIQLVKHSNVEVSVFLLQCSEEDRNNATSHDVQLVVAETLPGMNPVDCLMFVPDGHVMDCVVGHGVTLGKQAQAIRKLHQCKWIQVVHTASEELGMYKSISQALKGSSGGQSSHFSMKDGQFPLPSTSATQDKLVQVESHNQSSEGRPVIATRDKRSPSTVLGDHHSKPLGGRLLRFDHYEVLGCSSCGHSSHSFMEYGQSPFPTASLTQDKPVQQSSYTQGLRSRPVIATGDKRPASTVFGDHRSKQFRGEVNKYDFYEALKGTSVGQLSHSLMDYGEEHVEQRTQTQEKS